MVSDEKTEQPTPKRLRESRERGEVCKSQEAAASLTVLALAAYLIFGGQRLFTLLNDMVLLPMTLINRPFDEALPVAAAGIAAAAFLVVVPALALVMAVALTVNLAQTGMLFSFKAAMPKFSNVNPAKWFHKVFSLKNLVELMKNVLKIAVLAWAVRGVLLDRLPDLFAIRDGSIETLWLAAGSAIRSLLLVSAGCFCVIAVLDYLYQRWQYNKDHMMSREEVKREYREMEGDARIKGKRKQMHQELVAQGTMDKVRKAKVLVTNPTHFAVALDYDKDTTLLPVILAKGEGLLARRMIEVARQEGIPIMRDVPLAHDLFEQGTENAYIPKELIGPVAEVLRWVQSLNAKS